MPVHAETLRAPAGCSLGLFRPVRKGERIADTREATLREFGKLCIQIVVEDLLNGGFSRLITEKLLIGSILNSRRPGIGNRQCA